MSTATIHRCKRSERDLRRLLKRDEDKEKKKEIAEKKDGDEEQKEFVMTQQFHFHVQNAATMQLVTSSYLDVKT